MMRIARSLAMLWIPALYSMSGCAQIIGIEDLPAIRDGSIEPGPDADPSRPDARPADASIGSPDGGAPDAAGPLDGCEEWTPRPTHFDPCDLPAPSGQLILDAVGEYVYDTDDGSLRNPLGIAVPHVSVELPGSPLVRAISVASLRVSNASRLRVVGDLPLLVASWSTIEVDGTIDVSSTLAQGGAGANTGTCFDSQAGEQSDGGGGGGGGGGFRGPGGNGGDGSTSTNVGGTGGTSVAVPDTVRGGCPGARGGQGDVGDGGGAEGVSGGGLQLTARTSIVIEGTLHAGGSGGGGANGQQGDRSGGGGGGSGGLIDLEAPTIRFGADAVVAANGGGGGEGTRNEAARSGGNGRDSATPAPGGSGGSNLGGDGGNGSAGGGRDGGDGGDGIRQGGDDSGGGGGGGGAGYIIVKGDETVVGGAVLSPALIKRP